MHKRRLIIVAALVLTTTIIAALPSLSRAARATRGAADPGQQGSSVSVADREEAYRANNIGVALLEQFDHAGGAKEFRRALKLNPGFAIAQVNLSIALFYVPDAAGALREAKAAAAALPNAPQPHYILGLIYKGEIRNAEAVTEFQRVLQIDPSDPGANVNLGQIYMQDRKYAEAIPLFRAALASETANVTATYNLAMALLRAKLGDESQRWMKQFQKLRDGGYGITYGPNYLDQGRYAEAMSSTGAEAELVDANAPVDAFADVTSSLFPVSADARPPGQVPDSGSIFGRRINASQWNDAAKRSLAASAGGGVVLFDYDGDGELDLLEIGPSSRRLFHNKGGKFVDVTEGSGLASAPANTVGIGAVAGDYDNDGKPDLLVFGYGGLTLYHNDGNGKFSDVTAAAGIPTYPYLALSAAFVDADHDGDLDIFIAGFADLAKPSSSSTEATFPDDFAGAPNMLLRNNGNGKFTDITAKAGVAGNGGHAVAVVATDFDNHRDIDLLVVNYGAAPALFSNQRDGTFRDVAADAGLGVKGRFTSVAVGDVNKDGYTDFFFGKDDGPGVFAISDGRTHFVVSDAPAGSQAAGAAQFLDYDNDGLLDLMVFSTGGPRLLRNLGSKWEDLSDRAFAGSSTSTPRAFATGHIDCAGDADVVFRSPAGDLRAWRNKSGSRNHSLRVRLAAKVSNRNAIGAKIEMRAGSLRQKLETYSSSPAPAPADVVFGLGKRGAADAVRVLWPSGIVQAETKIPASSGAASPACAPLIKIEELDRKPSSCPYLYTWNGERFEFVTDFMGGGEMGYWEAPGQHNKPDPDEYVRIRGDQLKERNGRYELRVTNELEEVVYVDRLKLIAVAHPADTEVFPNEGMTDPPRPFKLFVTRDAHPPVSAIDDNGRNMTGRIAKLDRQFADGFPLLGIRGYAEPHTLRLDLGTPAKGRTLLLLTGWTDYAFSSDNVAAYQSGLTMKPPELQVKDASGRWQTAIPDIGIPVGRPQTIVVDLTGKFPTRNREVRIVTNMRIYWDQILVDTADAAVTPRLTPLDPLTADLHPRGFSAETSPDGREPFGYDYERVSSASPWKTFAGHYTRFGDVRELLLQSDDRFVISRPGDEIAVSFDATKLSPLPRGWKRTFLLYADGFSKEMDINSASPDAVGPLPFHGMRSYPYASAQSYPMDRAHRDYLERYNTRVVTSAVPSIDAVIGEQISGGKSTPAGRP